jgi:DNA mismatch repair protein MutS
MERLTRHFGVVSLDGFGCAGRPAAYGAAGALLDYLGRRLRRDLTHVRTLSFRHADDFLWMDAATASHLDLTPAHPGGRRESETSLAAVLDATRTAMGGRMLREWLRQPLARAAPIRERHEAVAALIADRDRLRDIRDRLGRIRDLERLIARLSAGAGHARDLLAVAESLENLPALKERSAGAAAPLLRELAQRIETQEPLAQRLRAWIVDDPPVSTREGGMIRPGCHAELDALREAGREARGWLADFQTAEQQRTGIRSLKVRYNQVFGYYIEIPKSQLDAVPAEYVRKQTLVNAERFVTPELKQYEGRVLGARERSVQLEYELFQQLRAETVAVTDALQRTAAAVAALDVLAAFADRALAHHYVRPDIAEDPVILIREGRHPVIEQLPTAERFVPNDTRLDCGENQILLLTGPNMAGKSTYIRQVALIVVMAQAGSFVPATEARIGLVDRLFTRIGASDDLAHGRSTFMVEMQETAAILNHLTPRSLIVLDEIGRGTSTFDGISIAWAVAEYLHQHPTARARTLFATHYHELTDLALTLRGVKNYNVAVREGGDRIVFLRKIVPGPADQSYGIQVARLAGMPPEVLERAGEILANLEEGEFADGGQPKIARRRPRRPRDDGMQLSLF